MKDFNTWQEAKKYWEPRLPVGTVVPLLKNTYNATKVVIISHEEYLQGKYPGGNDAEPWDLETYITLKYLDGPEEGRVNGYSWKLLNQRFDFKTAPELPNNSTPLRIYGKLTNIIEDCE